MNTSYSPAVSRLLRYGECKLGQWPDYLKREITREDIPELIRMATDMELNLAASDSLEVWAPVHAWRALGQLKAEEAVEPLLPMRERRTNAPTYPTVFEPMFANVKGGAASPKVGRNHPCPCGSGKKYKKCCLNK